MPTPFDDLDIPDWVKQAWSEPMAGTDVLFRSIKAGETGEHSWETNAWVSGASVYAYAEGYRRAARLIADHVIQSKWDIDFLLYPVAFLYRHNVELQLKRLIPDGAFLADMPLSDKDRDMVRTTHRLDHLWGLFKHILGKIATEFGVTEDDMKAITSYIDQIHKVDDGSFSFRYMKKESDDPSIDGGRLPHINVGALASAMEKITGLLFGLGEAFHEAVQVECEMRAEAYGRHVPSRIVRVAQRACGGRLRDQPVQAVIAVCCRAAAVRHRRAISSGRLRYRERGPRTMLTTPRTTCSILYLSQAPAGGSQQGRRTMTMTRRETLRDCARVYWTRYALNRRRGSASQR